MRLKKLTLAVSAAGLLLAAHQAAAQNTPQSVPAAASESSTLWFVELAGAPTVEGGALAQIRNEKAAFRRAALAAGIRYKERRSFDTLFNGFSVEVTPSQRARLSRLPGVLAMYPVDVLRAPKAERTTPGSITPQMATAISMTGAAELQAMGLTGAGIKVGIIDSGVDIDHPDLGGTGVPGTTPFPSSRVAYGYDFVGDAFNADPTSPAYNPVTTPDENPDDCGGHGTHVAGIVGANGTIKGVAPGVTFGAYRVFGCAGSTTSDVMVEAMERAYADGMQVVNQSIGSPFQWPQYPTARAASRMALKGVVMVASIGNSGTSGLYAAGAPGVGAEVIGVASYDNVSVTLNQFTLTPGGEAVGYGNATAAPPAPTSGSLPMAKTGTTTSTADGCSPLAPGSMSGMAVLIRRGSCGFYDKALNAQNAGAAAVVLYNNTTGRISPTVAGAVTITIPVVAVSDTEGALIDGKIAAGPTTMTWRADVGSFPNPTAGLISSFSSYGLPPDLSFKPNLGAPGGFIYSTYPLEAGGYTSLSGTSMSSPHVAGGVALILDKYPNLPAQQVLTRLQNVADPKNWSGNPGLGYLDFTHRQGAGMLDLVGVVNARAFVKPSQLALGESQSGPSTQTLTFTNLTRFPVTYNLSHVGSLATGPNTYTVGALLATAGVSFSASSITVPALKQASVNVTITAPAALADRGIYGGYIVATSATDGSVMRVPYSGFKGDYQAIAVLTSGGYGFPWLTKLTGGSYYNQPSGASYTLVGDDIPFFLAHLDHQSRLMKLEAFEAATGKSVGIVSTESFLPRNPTSTGFFAFTWDGTTGLRAPTYTVPNGSYYVTISVLKALGDPSLPTDWEAWTSPTITLARP